MAYYDRTIHPLLIYRLNRKISPETIHQLKSYCHCVTVSTDYSFNTIIVKLNGIHNIKQKILIDLLLSEYR